MLLTLSDGHRVVAKQCPQGNAAVEGWMLEYLRRHTRFPVPDVLYRDDTLLLMSYLQNDGSALGDCGQRCAAELIAELHGITAPRYGLECDTVIGGLAQPNRQSPSWLEFFGDRRLLFMGRRARESGKLDEAAFGALETLVSHLDRWLQEPGPPGLIHGDIWAGNIVVCNGGVSGFVDPAISYADPEIELAFSTLFATFGPPFFRRYQELRPIRPGFFEERRDLYKLYPLLVHTVLFGATYAASVKRTLRRFGYL